MIPSMLANLHITLNYTLYLYVQVYTILLSHNLHGYNRSINKIRLSLINFCFKLFISKMNIFIHLVIIVLETSLDGNI